MTDRTERTAGGTERSTDEQARTHVAVGSGNPAKIDAVERILEPLEVSVEGVSVESGVPEQPRSAAETIEGAENRARRARRAAESDVGVGLEGGVAPIPSRDGLYLIMWAAATDGDRLERGAGPTLRLPDGIATRVADGEELGPVMDDVLDATGTAEDQGAAGALTDGLTDRRTALGQAVAAAYGPFVSELYDLE